MRNLVAVLAFAGISTIVLAPEPAMANCHERLDAAKAQLASVPADHPERGKIQNMIDKAAKFQDHEKKKKCGNILKKATALMGTAGRSGGGKTAKKKGGAGKCVPFIEKVESNMHMFDSMKNKQDVYMSNLQDAKELQADGKHNKCGKLMKKTLKMMGL